MNKKKFDEKDFELIDKNLYQIIRTTGNCIEMRCRSTGHCWGISIETSLKVRYPFLIYHKHNLTDDYHSHYQGYSLEKCICVIMEHDGYVLNKSEPALDEFIRNEDERKRNKWF